MEVCTDGTVADSEAHKYAKKILESKNEVQLRCAVSMQFLEYHTPFAKEEGGRRRGIVQSETSLFVVYATIHDAAVVLYRRTCVHHAGRQLPGRDLRDGGGVPKGALHDLCQVLLANPAYHLLAREAAAAATVAGVHTGTMQGARGHAQLVVRCGCAQG